VRLWTLHPKHLDARGYRLDRAKVASVATAVTITATTGQPECERGHLLAKLRIRSPGDYRRLADVGQAEAHPLFALVEGPVAPWEVSRTSRTATPR
jgi:hypothetical protein